MEVVVAQAFRAGSKLVQGQDTQVKFKLHTNSNLRRHFMVSLRPSDASQGGSFPRGRLEITGAEFKVHDWGTGVTINGSGKSVAANLTLTSHEETDDEGKPLVFVNRVYSIGDPSRWVISGDGAKIEGDGQISKNFQFYRLVIALLES